MIHTTTQTGKFKLLARRLRTALGTTPISVETLTVGLLERLWHATATSAPRGDIGRYDDELIAEMMGWNGPAEVLVNALADSGWLDRHQEHRFVVHDWHDHAPNYVKGNVIKAGGFLSEAGHPLGLPPRGPAPRDRQINPTQTYPKEIPLNGLVKVES